VPKSFLGVTINGLVKARKCSFDTNQIEMFSEVCLLNPDPTKTETEIFVKLPFVFGKPSLHIANYSLDALEKICIYE